MKNSFGSHIQLTLFGESHGAAVGAVIDGIAPGLPVNMQEIEAEMDKRRAKSALSTARREADCPNFVSGIYNGYTTGTPICVLIENANTKSGDYLRTVSLLRPGHADYTAQVKYLGFQDPRGGGHFSGRLTAPLVALGALCRSILNAKDIVVGTHIARCAGVQDSPLPQEKEPLRNALERLNQMDFAVLAPNAGQQMREAILQAKSRKDSVGGVLETAVTGLPAGVGEPFFESIESVLSSLLFSIPAVKGVEFGEGFSFADLYGSTANDAFIANENGAITTATNHNGGINGGISNGMPLLLRTAIKPTPSIEQPQRTADISSGQNTMLSLQGRHDPCIVPRARAVVDALVAFGLCDLLTARFGTLWQREGFCGKV